MCHLFKHKAWWYNTLWHAVLVLWWNTFVRFFFIYCCESMTKSSQCCDGTQVEMLFPCFELFFCSVDRLWAFSADRLKSNLITKWMWHKVTVTENDVAELSRSWLEMCWLANILTFCWYWMVRVGLGLTHIYCNEKRWGVFLEHGTHFSNHQEIIQCVLSSVHLDIAVLI